MGKLLWILLFVFCVIAVQGKKKAGYKPVSTDEPEEKGMAEGKEESENEEEPAMDETRNDFAGSGDEEPAEETKEFQCNLKFKRVGCYADKSKTKHPLKSFIMTDQDLGDTIKRGKLPSDITFNSELPKFVCKCANEAMNTGNAIFGIQNIAECWSGPDSSRYDKDGPSEDCVTFDYAPCDESSEVCAGKKHTNFVYFVDAPEHTKTSEEIQKELIAQAAKQKKQNKKADNKKKSKKTSKKKGKKSKKE